MRKNENKIVISEKTLVAFDLDGTLTTSRSCWEDIHRSFGTWESHGKALLDQFLRGELTYEEFDKKDAEVWTGRTEKEYLEALDTIVLREGIEELIIFLKQRGCILVIISMGLKEIVERVANQYEFDYWVANELIWKDGVIAGDVIVNVGWNEKSTLLKDILDKFQIDPQNSIAIGDSSADIDMFEEAGYSIAIGASSDKVIQAADFVCKTENLSEIISFFDT
ncbi:MAG: HAD family hydrolase [Candidatus Hodarchaeales archaeon]|jgi:phosphoserine phosphatase